MKFGFSLVVRGNEATPETFARIAERAEALGVPFADRGVKVNRETFQLAVPHLFAAGSAVTPLKHHVHAVAAGRGAAEAISLFLAGKPQYLFRLSPLVCLYQLNQYMIYLKNQLHLLELLNLWAIS